MNEQSIAMDANIGLAHQCRCEFVVSNFGGINETGAVSRTQQQPLLLQSAIESQTVIRLQQRCPSVGPAVILRVSVCMYVFAQAARRICTHNAVTSFTAAACSLHRAAVLVPGDVPVSLSFSSFFSFSFTPFSVLHFLY
eukprot:GHVU01222675.1.p1 GENE.GHVU01222675.1~~GHVU01222675.1.p1  ORF type:complete len:139 (-),score=4.93 GHVU01222675.1:583-999(-)